MTATDALWWLGLSVFGYTVGLVLGLHLGRTGRRASGTCCDEPDRS